METWKESQLKQLTFAKSVDTAYPILLRFAENLGFNFCAVTVAMPQQVTSPNTLQINNYPEQWNTQYEQKKFISIDPVVAHCNHSMMPIVLGRNTLCEGSTCVASPAATRPATWLVAIFSS